MLLQTLLKPTLNPELACDVLVIGGGSGGLACVQAVSKLVKSVVLCDFVRPSDTKQTTWGLGGTCVNVGCVPKKLFHRAGLLGHSLDHGGEMAKFGFSLPKSARQADWGTLVSTVQNHVKMLNFTYRASLPPNCTFVNGQAEFVQGSSSGMVVRLSNGQSVHPSRAVVVAVGGRPWIPSTIPGAREFGITSDDLFSLPKSPGKTLVVGSSYIGLETASFLQGIGCDTTLLVRSLPLRNVAGFDSECAEKVLRLVGRNVRVVRNLELTRVFSSGVEFSNGTMESFDTVLFATGRRPEVESLRLANDDVHISSSSGKIRVDAATFHATSQGDVDLYAIGDCADTGSPELTPVAIRQGEMVAARIAGLSVSPVDESALSLVPSTVFSLPCEYSRIGLSESEAVECFGEDDVEVYLREWEPLEMAAAGAHLFEEDAAFVKMICVKSQDERVVGLHLITPQSSEVIHALSLACALGAKKKDFDKRVLGVHPTDAEALTDCLISKRSKLPFRVSGGCGGGKCG